MVEICSASKINRSRKKFFCIVEKLFSQIHIIFGNYTFSTKKRKKSLLYKCRGFLFLGISPIYAIIRLFIRLFNKLLIHKPKWMSSVFLIFSPLERFTVDTVFIMVLKWPQNKHSFFLYGLIEVILLE